MKGGSNSILCTVNCEIQTLFIYFFWCYSQTTNFSLYLSVECCWFKIVFTAVILPALSKWDVKGLHHQTWEVIYNVLCLMDNKTKDCELSVSLVKMQQRTTIAVCIRDYYEKELIQVTR